MFAFRGDTTGARVTVDPWSQRERSHGDGNPCSSCSAAACGSCSLRAGGPPQANGLPSGYAPRSTDLHLWKPSDSDGGSAGGIAPIDLWSQEWRVLGQPNDAVGGAGTDTGTPFVPQAGPSSGAQTVAAPVLNAIALENQKQGTPESQWLINSQSSNIEGYAAQFSLNHGQTVDFKINTTSTHYRVDIYRLGYYNGDGARLVATIDKSLSTRQAQPTPLFNSALKLVDAGNWAVSASWAIPADAVSGIYIAELTRLDGTSGQNIIPFIVRDDDHPSDITFQTSDETWQAYNWWGGYNFYGSSTSNTREQRAYAVSYNRPIITRDGGVSAGAQDFIFSVEYPTIRWLEENGYDVNYIAGMDTARDGAQLLNSNIFLSVGHDEYWSADQRANVEAARDAGVNLAFFSGNEVYWETRWGTSIDGSGTPYKTLISYKETWANSNIDTAGVTGTWRDPLYGAGKPENALTGTMFTVDSYRLDTIQIPYNLSNFRFWSNTAVANIQPGQVYSLTPNLLGYEWDSDLDNGFRPAGLVTLSSTTVNVSTELLDNGTTTGTGTANHSLTLYRAPSGALVFSSGSVYWSWGLDSHHDNEATPTDPNVQQAMVNLFADMGVQPTTLLASLAAATQTTDTTAPTSTVTSPTAGGSIVAGQSIAITGTAVDNGGGIVAVVEVSTDGGVTWHRANGFENWTYTWVPIAGGTYNIKSRAVDDSVNLETPGAGVTVSVAPATVSLFSPSDAQAAVGDSDNNEINLGVKFTSSQSGLITGIRFYKQTNDDGTHVGSLWTSSGTLLASATFTAETDTGWQQVNFATPIAITAGTTYVASYHSNGHYSSTGSYFATAHTNGPLTAPVNAGVYSYGNSVAFPNKLFNAENYWVDVVFTNANQPNLPPTAVNDSGFVATLNTALSIATSSLVANDIDPNGDLLTVTGVSGATNGTVNLNSQTNTITFTPTAGYTGPGSFSYSISDGRGGTSSATVSLTVSPPQTTFDLFLPTDTPAITDPDTNQVNLGVKFTSSQAGMITGIRYYKGSQDTGTHVASLWTSTGTLLASATFTNETASGWQQVNFATPVSITAGTTYVASYHSNGHYMTTRNYFATAHTSGPLTAPINAGVYSYSSSSVMPTLTYNAENYWVDVVLNTASQTNQPPVAANDSNFNTLLNTALVIAGSTLLANDSDPNGDALTITSVSAPTNGTVSLNTQTSAVTFTPTTNYTGPASFTYAISDGRGGTASATVSLFVDTPPVAVSDSGFTTMQNTAVSIPATSLIANDSDANGDTLTVTGVSAPSNGTVSLNTQTNTITFTPTTNYTGPASFTYTISDGRGGTASANVSLTVNPTVNQPPVAVNDSSFNTLQNTVLSIAAASLLANDSDPNNDPLTVTSVGAPVNGTVSLDTQTNTITFTPAANYTGPASFTYTISDGRGGTASANVSVFVDVPPVAVNDSGYTTLRNTALAITAASLLANDSDANGDTLTLSNVSAPVNGTVSLNSQTNTITFTPTNNYTGAASFTYTVSDGHGGTASANVSLTVNPPPNQPPVAVADSGFTTTVNTALSIPTSSLLANDSDPNGDTLTVSLVSAPTNGTVSLNSQTNTVTFTPTTNYSGAAGFTYTISDGQGGTASAAVSLAVNNFGPTQRLFTASNTPAIVSDPDTSSVELGVKFQASSNGLIDGILFYKGPLNTGTHTAHLWNASGTLLATATFTNETASGWQQVNFSSSVPITAGTTYIASYHSNGRYSVDENYFTTAHASGSLTAPSTSTSGGNGVYAYGSSALFPSDTYAASNYWVDVLFRAQLA